MGNDDRRTGDRPPDDPPPDDPPPDDRPPGGVSGGVEAGGDREQPLAGGWQTEVHRSGDRVLRSAGPQSPTVIRLLHHLHENGFEAAPRPVDGGFAPDGREQLGFIEGGLQQPAPWTVDGIREVGRLLRQLHEAAAGFDPGPDPRWRPWFGRDLGGDRTVIGHGDLGPWNILVRHDRPVAFIDWDNAGPVDARWELAQAGWLNAQLHDDDVAARNDLPPAAVRIGQLVALLDGYGLRRADRALLVDRMIEFAVRSARDEAVMGAVGPDTASPDDRGFPTLWAVTWRSRAAAWMLDHRRQLETALSA